MLRKAKDPCIKRKGPRAEEILNPEWLIIVPDDCKVDPEDSLAYHYAFSDDYFQSTKFTFDVRLLRMFRAGFGGFIPSASLRHAILAEVYQHIDDSTRSRTHRQKVLAALRKLNLTTVGDGDLMAVYLLAFSPGFGDESVTHQNGIAAILNSLYSKERLLCQTSDFIRLRPIFTSYVRHALISVEPQVPCDIETFANVFHTVHEVPLDYDLLSDRYTALDCVMLDQLMLSVRAARLSDQKYPKTKEEHLNLTSCIRAVDADLFHSPLVEMANQIALKPVPLPRLAAIRCFIYLFTSFFVRTLDCWMFQEADTSSELVATAWQLVRLIHSEKYLVSDWSAVELVTSALFLGSCFLPSCEARDASISETVFDLANISAVADKILETLKTLCLQCRLRGASKYRDQNLLLWRCNGLLLGVWTTLNFEFLHEIVVELCWEILLSFTWIE